jgi:Matrixin
MQGHIPNSTVCNPSSRLRSLAAALLVLVSCGGGSSPSAPSAPAIPATPPPPAAPVDTWSAAGIVTALDSGQPISSATLTPGWSLAPVTTNASGAYVVGDVANPPTSPYPVTLSADGMLAHKAWILWARGPRTGVNIALIHNAAPFSLGFYQQFVRGTYDEEDAPYPILRWTTAPSFYIRTVDQVGAPIAQSVLDVVVDAINRAVPAFTGGRYTPVAIQLGTGVRPQAANWINIDIQKKDASFSKCGDSYVGENPGQINLYEDVCSCARIPGNVVMHEVGHALGFFHVADKASVMYPDDISPTCAGALSAAEVFHANIAYSRPNGNTDPDDDPDDQGVLGFRKPRIRIQ